MSELTTQSPGEILKTSREKLGLTINDVSLATKINPRILKALEEGSRDQLPPKSFTRGFIRSYAGYLKIDAKPILDGYELGESSAVSPAVNTKPSEVNAAATKESSKKQSTSTTHDHSLTSKALVGSGIVVLLVLIFGIKKIVDKYSAEATVPVSANEQIVQEEPVAVDANTNIDTAAEEPTEQVVEEKPVADTKPTETKADTKPVAETKPTETKADTKPVAETKPAETKADTKPVAETKPAETKADTKPVAETKPTETKADTKPVAETKPAEKKSTPQEIIIEALDKVEIRAKIDDGDWKTIELQPEGVHTIKAKNLVSLEISDGGMVNIVQNGTDRGAAGDLGKPAKVKYP